MPFFTIYKLFTIGAIVPFFTISKRFSGIVPFFTIQFITCLEAFVLCLTLDFLVLLLQNDLYHNRTLDQ